MVADRYRIFDQLGKGGMAVVYRAEDTKLQREVALKFLPLGLLDESTARERFRREAQAASALDHHNICTIHEIDETPEGQLFIVMGYYPGETLDRHIARGPLPLSQAAEIAIQIASGLVKAHQKGIVHRDIKPANIMITADNTVKILDFGVAKLSGTDFHITQPGTAVGTVTYMSPEQVRGAPVDHRCDIWALGVILYEMIAGRVPFRGDNQMAVLNSIVGDEPPPLTVQDSSELRTLESILSRALAKDPQGRYQDLAEMLTGLRTLKDECTSVTVVSPAPWVPSPSEPSIAVLPFADLSLEQDQEYFCCGMAEELISLLARVEGLRVASRTSAFQFLGKSEDVRKIGSQLNVEWILEGSVRKAGQRLRITAQLVKVADGYQLWSGRYDREMKDLFAIQDEIAEMIVQALEVTLVREPQRTQIGQDTASLEAYNLYLHGRHSWNKRTEEELKKGIEYFQQAIERKPDYARAYAGLADSYVILGIYGALPPQEVMPRAKAAAERALTFNDRLAEVYASRGCVRASYDWDFAAATRDFQHALQLDPHYATTHQWYAMNCLIPLGRFAEARRELQKAQQLDPLSLAIGTSLGLQYFYARQYREAAEELRKALEIDRNFAMAHFFLGQTYEQVEMFEKALEELQEALRLAGGSLEMTAALGHTYGQLGDQQRARELLAKLRTAAADRYVSPALLAQVHVGLGETEQAVAALQDAYRVRAADLIWVNVRPAFDALRGDARFQDLIHRVGLVGHSEGSAGGLPPTVT